MLSQNFSTESCRCIAFYNIRRYVTISHLNITLSDARGAPNTQVRVWNVVFNDSRKLTREMHTEFWLET
jgi:hypothetical protein